MVNIINNKKGYIFEAILIQITLEDVRVHLYIVTM